jgi:homopolymeric O-antigen transport system permease protein
MKLSAINHSGYYLRSHSRLLWRITRSEVTSRYAGSIFGLGWAVLTPLMMLAIYAVVYLLIFRVRVPGLSSARYVLLIFSGLVPFLMTSEALSFGVVSVVANKAVLSNTVFPIDLAPVKAVLLSQITMIVGLVVILVASIGMRSLPWTIVFLPVVWALHLLALTGLLWMLSLVNLVFRDLPNLINLLMMMIMILSPIAYTPDMVPAGLKPLLVLNPMAYFIVAYQSTVILGRLPSATNMLVVTTMSIGLFAAGGYFFARAKPVFIDYV